MTPSLDRGRLWWAYVLVGFVLLGRTVWAEPVVAITGEGPGASAAGEGGASVADLVLPLVAVGAAAVLAGYGYVRRTRRVRERTTPGGGRGEAASVEAPPDEPDSRALALLAQADDWVRTSREELGFAEDRFGAVGVESPARVVREAAGELAAAFRMRQLYDEGVPADETARRHALAGIVGRCEEAGRRLDAEAAGFDRLRGLEEQGLAEALGVAETRFRELAGRTGAAETVLVGLRTRYAPSASAAVTGSVEQAKDRLVFATTRLNHARQAADREDDARAAAHLRAAEGAITQAGVLVDGVHRLAAELEEAARMVPAALTGAEAEIAGADTLGLDVPVGELRSRVLHADAVLAAVRQELTSGHPYDPLGVLRRVVRATAPLVTGRAGVLPAAALLTARAATDAAADFVMTHRGAVGGTARTRLAEAERLLTTGDGGLVDLLRADTLARTADDLAELDVRIHGNPYAGTAAGYASGVTGAVLGGVLLGGGAGDGGPPASFGGSVTRARRTPAVP
ncbi:hypothetical protein ACFYWX_05560 [Streptomyces sp. NPDC002888]|uniref:hypothetical protein n=1 Tax=Streptomyces sp. NPDC002888 TaxID=3364668 RepID=UPI0036B97A7D